LAIGDDIVLFDSIREKETKDKGASGNTVTYWFWSRRRFIARDNPVWARPNRCATSVTVAHPFSVAASAIFAPTPELSRTKTKLFGH
jgi:hypothetical protein